MTSLRPRRLSTAIACLALVLAAGPACAADDPFEEANRRIHHFNQQLRAHVLAPLARHYVSLAPAALRQGIAQATANLGEPVTAVNGLIAGEMGIARHALARFGINSTLGWGGVRDVAAARGLPRRPMGLADAACSWGVPSGPYLVIPVLGPSTLRDAAALVITSATLAQVMPGEVVAGLGTGEAFVAFAAQHETLAHIDAASLDPYATLRSAYLQRRAASCATDHRALLAQDAEEDEDGP